MSGQIVVMSGYDPSFTGLPNQDGICTSEMQHKSHGWHAFRIVIVMSVQMSGYDPSSTDDWSMERRTPNRGGVVPRPSSTTVASKRLPRGTRGDCERLREIAGDCGDCGGLREIAGDMGGAIRAPGLEEVAELLEARLARFEHEEQPLVER